jgi:uncharacterized membrane protein
MGLGAYVIIAGMSLYFMHQHKSTSIGSRVTVAYTWSMLLITIAWYYCSTRVSEVQLIENPTFSASPSAILSYCSTTSVAGTLLSTFQFFGSDALLVRTFEQKTLQRHQLSDTTKFFRVFVLFEKRWIPMIIPGVIYLAYFGECSLNGFYSDCVLRRAHKVSE